MHMKLRKSMSPLHLFPLTRSSRPLCLKKGFQEEFSVSSRGGSSQESLEKSRPTSVYWTKQDRELAMAMSDHWLPLEDDRDQRKSPTTVESLLSWPVSEERTKENLGTAG